MSAKRKVCMSEKEPASRWFVNKERMNMVEWRCGTQRLSPRD
ncbi:hypothetical protein [Metallosphaera javensis (ex Sakai et al. 2022)]